MDKTSMRINVRRIIILELRDGGRGLSYRKIGKIVGLSPQGVWNIVNGSRGVKKSTSRTPVLLRINNVMVIGYIK